MISRTEKIDGIGLFGLLFLNSQDLAGLVQESKSWFKKGDKTR